MVLKFNELDVDATENSLIVHYFNENHKQTPFKLYLRAGGHIGINPLVNILMKYSANNFVYNWPAVAIDLDASRDVLLFLCSQ